MRVEDRPFTDRQVALLETFADQAVIAIENARLFEELEQRNADSGEQPQVTEALEQQTATAEVLRVIATSPTDAQAVLQAIVDAAARLSDAPSGALLQRRDRDGRLDWSLHHGLDPPAVPLRRTPFETDRAPRPTGHRCLDAPSSMVGSSGSSNVDEAVKTEFPGSLQTQADFPHTEHLSVPLMRRGRAHWRHRSASFRGHTRSRTKRSRSSRPSPTRPSSPSRTPGCSRNWNERNHELSDALERQTATTDVLRVIATHPDGRPARARYRGGERAAAVRGEPGRGVPA